MGRTSSGKKNGKKQQKMRVKRMRKDVRIDDVAVPGK